MKYCVSISEFIRTLNKIADFQDVSTKDHSRRTKDVATKIAIEAGITGDDLIYIGYGADIHDIGKVAIDPFIIRQASKLTRAQYAAVMKHCEFGYEMVKDTEIPRDVMECILYHQEHCDGSGYPYGLVSDEIPIGAKITCIADVWESINSDRPYRKAFGENAMPFMHEHSNWFDGKLFSIFIKLQENNEI